jgi:precorrin-8X/cobalt-precorrin-8 methylmutase
MTVQLQDIAPADIERESFKIIKEELGPIDVDEKTFSVIRRVIHATGDFSFKENMRLSPEAIATGIKAIHDGKDILTDVTMVAAGISKPTLARWGGKVICRVADEEVATLASRAGKTRSEMAIELCLKDNIGIVAIGNAPTALVQTIRMLSASAMKNPPLVVGVPVGFVNAKESKDMLVEQNNCYITSLGRKGGSPVAAAIVNALLRLANE